MNTNRIDDLERNDKITDKVNEINSTNEWLQRYNKCPYLLPCGYCEKTGRVCVKHSTEPTVEITY